MLLFFDDKATTEIYTLSLHDALPIYFRAAHRRRAFRSGFTRIHAQKVGSLRFGLLDLLELSIWEAASLCFHLYTLEFVQGEIADRKSTRLNSSHLVISYAVFCLKKKQ